MTAMIDYLLALGKANPTLTAMVLGTISGWATATLGEFLLAATTYSPAVIKRIVILLTVIACGIATNLLWSVFDPTTLSRTRTIVCYVLAPISPFSYIWAAKIASKYVPWINSIWSLDRSPKE